MPDPMVVREALAAPGAGPLDLFDDRFFTTPQSIETADQAADSAIAMLQEGERLSSLWRYVFVELLDDYTSVLHHRGVSTAAQMWFSPPRSTGDSRVDAAFAGMAEYLLAETDGRFRHGPGCLSVRHGLGGLSPTCKACMRARWSSHRLRSVAVASSSPAGRSTAHESWPWAIPTDVVRQAAAVAERERLAEDWLNDAVKGFLPGPDPDAQRFYSSDSLIVDVASPDTCWQ